MAVFVFFLCLYCSHSIKFPVSPPLRHPTSQCPPKPALHITSTPTPQILFDNLSNLKPMIQNGDLNWRFWSPYLHERDIEYKVPKLVAIR